MNAGYWHASTPASCLADMVRAISMREYRAQIEYTITARNSILPHFVCLTHAYLPYVGADEGATIKWQQKKRFH